VDSGLPAHFTPVTSPSASYTEIVSRPAASIVRVVLAVAEKVGTEMQRSVLASGTVLGTDGLSLKALSLLGLLTKETSVRATMPANLRTFRIFRETY